MAYSNTMHDIDHKQDNQNQHPMSSMQNVLMYILWDSTSFPAKYVVGDRVCEDEHA